MSVPDRSCRREGGHGHGCRREISSRTRTAQAQQQNKGERENAFPATASRGSSAQRPRAKRDSARIARGLRTSFAADRRHSTSCLTQRTTFRIRRRSPERPCESAERPLAQPQRPTGGKLTGRKLVGRAKRTGEIGIFSTRLEAVDEDQSVDAGALRCRTETREMIKLRAVRRDDAISEDTFRRQMEKRTQGTGRDGLGRGAEWVEVGGTG